MTQGTKAVTRVALACVAIAWLGFSPGAVFAAGPAFDASTVAHRYNFIVSGEGASGSQLTMIGWFEADGSGNVTSGGCRAAFAFNSAPIWVTLTLDPAATNKILVLDPTNGMYELTVKFVRDAGGFPVNLSSTLLLDDPRGRSGKIASNYLIEGTLPISGMAVGEVVSQ